MIPQLSLSNPGPEQAKAGRNAAPGFLEVYSGKLAPGMKGEEEQTVLTVFGNGKSVKASAPSATKIGASGRAKKAAVTELGCQTDFCIPPTGMQAKNAALPELTPVVVQEPVDQVSEVPETPATVLYPQNTNLLGVSTEPGNHIRMDVPSLPGSPEGAVKDYPQQPSFEPLRAMAGTSRTASGEAPQLRASLRPSRTAGENPSPAAVVLANRASSPELERPKAAATRSASLPENAAEREVVIPQYNRDIQADPLRADVQPVIAAPEIEVPVSTEPPAPSVEGVTSKLGAQDGTGRKSSGKAIDRHSLGTKINEGPSEPGSSRDEQHATVQAGKPSMAQTRPTNSSRDETPSTVTPTTSTWSMTQGTPRTRDLGSESTAQREHATEAKVVEKTPNSSPNGAEAEVQINLHTAELGRVEVRTAIHNTQVSTTISVENSSARSAVAAELSQLPSALSHYRLELDSAVVQVRGGDPGSAPSFGDSGQQRQQRQQPSLSQTVSDFHSATDKAEDGREDMSLNVRA